MPHPAEPDHWHALDAPFTPYETWQPEPGTCSRCGRAAERGEHRWWHLGERCPGLGRLAAHFVPTPPPSP
ncbi:hypothetical protein KCMC57_63790 (plasmid) [Kitasatospora sp. CMC57]|uniref:Uncharacterized protein n=1 Tax=Kitasatospora sp. CMC57 TaxID=3231513 RepID=A0AB33K5C8_9ACTN